MTNPMKVIHNVETGETFEIEMTDAEYASHLESIKNAEIAIEAEKAAKAAKVTALNKLAALGLSEADLKALGL